MNSGSEQVPIIYLPGVDGAPYAGDAVLDGLPEATTAQFLYPREWAANRHLDQMAARLLEWLDARGFAQVDLIGESYGGALAQVFTRANPGRVRRLVMLASFTRNPSPFIGFVVGPALRVIPKPLMKPPVMLVARLTMLRGAPKDSRMRFYERTFQMPFVDIGLRIRAIRGYDSRPWIADLPHPTLWVWGDREKLVNAVGEMRFLQSARPKDRLVFIEGAGHVIPNTHREVLLAHIRSLFGMGRRA